VPGPSLVDRVFARPGARFAAPALAALFALPTVRIGFYCDDWSQIVHLRGRMGFSAQPWDLYRFADGDPAHLHEQMLRGPVPWFTDPHLKLWFLRPLSSLLIALDLRVFGVASLGWHLHAIVWYVAMVVLVGVLFRRLLPASPGIAHLAACLYAIDGAHVEPVGWLACRHMLVAAVPAIGALLLHTAARERGLRVGRWLAPLAFAVALAGSEAGLGVLGFLGAYEAFGPPRTRGEPLVRRLGALLPYLGVLAIYAVIYKAIGCGAGASGGYIDPVSDPVRFAGAAVDRLPILVSNLAWVVPADFANIAPHLPLWIAGVAGLLVFGALLRAVFPALDAEERSALGWLLPGAGLALVASLGGYPGARILVLPSVATALLFATIIVRGAIVAAKGARRIGVTAGRVATIVLHVGFAALLFFAQTNGVAEMSRKMVDLGLSTELGPDVAGSRAIILASSDPYAAFYLPAPLLANDRPIPRVWQVISMAKTTHRITRTGDRIIRLRMLDAPMLRGSFEQVLRAPSRSFAVGDRVELDGLTVSVVEVDDGVPRELEVESVTSLDDPACHLFAFRESELARVRLAVGESIEVPWSPGPTGLF
jgi:hypothetical protein